MVQQCRRCGQVHDAYTGCTLAIGAARRPTVVGEDEALVGNIVAERYRVGDVIGQGATGTVFAVEHVTFARAAAMKVLRQRYADADVISRVFHGEARAAWSVSHPCLCEVFDIGTLPDGAPFFVMERLEGETLATRIRRERLSIASSVDVMMQMLSAIAAIHARALLVRDLRPQNIFLVERRGCRPLLKILDFGLARLAPLERIQEEWDSLREMVGASDGVGWAAIPYYLSPERTRGEHGIEPASDLFVAAAIFYEALSGERTFVSSSFDGVLLQICQGKPVPLHECRPDVSPELSALISRSLSPNPRVRPASAKDMQEELRAIFDGARKGSSSTHVSAAASLVNAVAAPAGSEPPHAGEHSSTFASITAPPLTPHGTKQTSAHSPPSSSYGRDIPRSDEPYADETETKRERIVDAQAAALAATDDGSTDRHLIHPRFLDEASAENIADRTVPPPRPDAGIEVDVSFDDPVDKAVVDRRRPAPREDEETETKQLTPELRDQIEQLMAKGPAPIPVLPLPAPPPRVKPPRR